MIEICIYEICIYDFFDFDIINIHRLMQFNAIATESCITLLKLNKPLDFI